MRSDLLASKSIVISLSLSLYGMTPVIVRQTSFKLVVVVNKLIHCRSFSSLIKVIFHHPLSVFTRQLVLTDIEWRSCLR